MKPKRKSISPAMRKRVLDRDGHKCVKCGACEVPLQLDHVVAVQKFGAHTDNNLVTLCIDCHKFKSRRDNQDIRKVKKLETARKAVAEGVEKPKRKAKIANPGWGQYRQKMNGEITRREE